MDFIIDEVISMSFVTNENIRMDFILKEEFTSKYANLETTNKVKIDSTMNYLRYKRIDEISQETINSLTNKTIKEITEEEG